MSDHKIVYLIVERGIEPNRQVFWRAAGSAFVCRDGSLNLKLDIHPGLTFNIREPKSNGEREDAESPTVREEVGSPEQARVVAFPNPGNGHTARLPNVEIKQPAASISTVRKPALANQDDPPF